LRVEHEEAQQIELGRGELQSRLAARNLVSRGANVAFVANRTPERATALAERLRSRPLALDAVADELAGVDVLVSSTSSPDFVLTRSQVEAVIGRRRGRPLFLIDLAVPRDVEPAVGELDGCFLYDIDDLEAVVAESLAGRRREAERAETIVAAEASAFRDWLASLDVVPAIASLREHAEAIRTAELAKAQGRLEGLSASERRTVESLTSQIVNKLLHAPIVRAKEAAALEGVGYADALRHLFGLDEDGRDAHPRRLPGQ